MRAAVSRAGSMRPPGEWARREATRRVDVAADRAAARRTEARASHAELTGSVADLQSTRERAGLVTRERVDGPVVCPYKGLASFDADDAEYFFGRERLVAELVARLVGAPLLAIVGPSGSGKSSAMRAGLLPALAGGVLPGSQQLDAGADPPRRPSVARARARDPPAGAGVASRARRGPVRGAVHALPGRGGTCRVRRRAAPLRATAAASWCWRSAPTSTDAAPRIPSSRGCSAPTTCSWARCRARSCAGRSSARPSASACPSSPTLPRRCSATSRGSRARCRCSRPRCSSCGASATRSGCAWPPTPAAAASTARWHGSPRTPTSRSTRPQQAAARRLMLRLTDEGENGAVVRRRLALGDLDAELSAVVAALSERRLLTVSDGAVEVAHEALLREWPRLRGWLEEDVQGRRVHRRLSDAARAWDTDGRDSGSLYRGGRLASALDWAAEHDPELTATERAFLEDSRRASGRAQRRLRAVLAGVATLLVLAVIAGVVALDQRSNARAEATTAAAQRLGAQALADDDLDRSLLLARQGVALDDTLQTRGNLLAALLRTPAATGVLRGAGDRLVTVALSPDGRTAGDDRDRRHVEPLRHRVHGASRRARPWTASRYRAGQPRLAGFQRRRNAAGGGGPAAHRARRPDAQSRDAQQRHRCPRVRRRALRAATGARCSSASAGPGRENSLQRYRRGAACSRSAYRIWSRSAPCSWRRCSRATGRRVVTSLAGRHGDP